MHTAVSVTFSVLSSVQSKCDKKNDFLLCTEEGTLNATETAVCNLFEKFIGAPNVVFPLVITSAKYRHTSQFQYV